MNRPIRSLAIVILALVIALMANASYVQFVRADSLNAMNGNKRVINDQFARERGPILVAGEVVAESVPIDSEFKFQRTYYDHELYGKVSGYFSYIFGRGAIENSYNDVLSGSDDRLIVTRFTDLLSNKQPRGGSVELTIDPAAQKAAQAGLAKLGKQTKGAVVAIDPKSGAILAMVDRPTYDPNDLASHDFESTEDVWEQLQSDPNQPMLNRGTQLVLPPGSTFKLVTAASAIENLGLKPDDKVKAGKELTFPGIRYTLRNSGGGNCGGNEITFQQALVVSCNVSFGWLAGEVGQDNLQSMAEAFGFETKTFNDLPTAISRFTASPGVELEAPQLAQSGIGQFEVAASPLQMAMVASGIANGGKVMAPYVVKAVRAPNLSVLEIGNPETQSEPISTQTANYLTQMMVATVDKGTARSAKISGISVAGKTGTAQSAKDRAPYAWFVAFAPANNPQVAVAVLVEASKGVGEVSGGRIAGPIAKSVMEAVINK